MLLYLRRELIVSYYLDFSRFHPKGCGIVKIHGHLALASTIQQVGNFSSRLSPPSLLINNLMSQTVLHPHIEDTITRADIMSFGISISDFESIAKYSWKIYKACQGASSAFEEISREALCLHVALKELEDAARDPTSLFNRATDSKKQEVLRCIRNCRKTLGTLENMVGKYHSLGTDKERKLDIIRFAAEKLEPLRSRLMLSVTNLTLILNSLETSSLARIETLLEKLIGEVRPGRKAPTVLPTVLDDLSIGWPQLENELTNVGITKAEVEMYKGPIQDWIREANEDGLLDDPDPRVNSDKAIHLRPLSVIALSTSSTRLEDAERITASRVPTEGEPQVIPTRVENEDGHDDDMSIEGITFHWPIESPPFSVGALSTSSVESKKEHPRPSISSTDSIRAPVLSSAAVETDPSTTTTKAPVSISTSVQEKKPNTTPSKAVPSTGRHYKNCSTSMDQDEHPIKADTQGYLTVPAMSMTPANSTKEFSNDAPVEIPINTERKFGSSVTVERSKKLDPSSASMKSFWNYCGHCQCCRDDALNEMHSSPAGLGVINVDNSLVVGFQRQTELLEVNYQLVSWFENRTNQLRSC